MPAPESSQIPVRARDAAGVRSGPLKWLRAVGVRLVFLLLVFGAVDVIFEPFDARAAHDAVAGLAAGVATAGIALFAYVRLVGWLEQRTVAELDFRTMRPQLARGLGLGIGLFGAVIAMVFACGGYQVRGWGSFGGMVATFGLMVGAATFEELMLRGVLFRIVEERAGTTVALVVSSLLFGALHLLNAGATLWGALAIAVEAGLLLGAAFVATRSLWLPIGIHLGWNFAESGIFGTTVSGASGTAGGLFKGAAHGPALISGGGFGPEASVFAVLVGAIGAALMLRSAGKQGRARKAPWR